ncbi:S-methyl-5-thioribose-1-phosphate isomerase [Pseudomonas fluvialis]|uniref:S-methyl-5-thioribose-1-phosphate isomerase n=1 Tax=Pseudomonas fluvialis TaxID=1793966 RepID=UPI0035B4EA94
MREQLLAAEQIQAIHWRDDALYLLDQRLLPQQQVWLAFDSAAGVARAIAEMIVRGAPAIGIAAAYAVVLAARQRRDQALPAQLAGLEADCRLLAAARPTAVNLSWALNCMRERWLRLRPGEDLLQVLEAEARGIHASDREANLTMAQYGMEEIRRHQASRQCLLTHCNAGALATGGFGTALGVIRAAHLAGLVERVYADETRPWLQGARLTAWELAEDGVPVYLNADVAAAHLMKSGEITWVIVGADRIAANGDVANKIGTYQLAINAMHHGLRFMVVAPSSTIDMSLAHGDDIPIEERDGRELLELGGQRVAAEVPAVNPVFDVTPADLIDVIVTEKGVVERPTEEKMAQLMSRKRLH